jgi:hypothetical protein
MKIMMSSVVYAMSRCVKSIRALVSNSKALASTVRILSNTTRPLTSTFTNVLGASGTLTARALQGLSASPIGLACAVATVIGISLSIAEPIEVQAQQMPTTLYAMADYQLTDKQYKCHNRIVHRESRGNRLAVGNLNGTKQVHGYYQIKSESIRGADDYYQFWIYWKYVSHRYGITKYDEPNYCKALQHLKNKGWQ